MTTSAALPLAGVRVIDLSALLPGPYASQVLVDLGATVLKVERAPDGDALRQLMPQMYGAVNRGKHSVKLDLKDEADRDLLLDLASDAEVFIEGFRPGVVDRLGVGFEAVRSRRPDVIYCSISGWGQTGPLAGDTGHNGNYLARSGAIHLTGPAGHPPDDSLAIQVADLGAALFTVIGILSALRISPRDAMHLDVSMFSAGLSMMAPRLAEYAGKGATTRDEIMRRPGSGVFCTGDGKYLTLAAIEDHFWAALCPLIGRPDLASHPDYATYLDRYAHVDEIEEAVSTALAEGTRDEWVSRFAAHGVPAAPVLAPEEVLADPQAQHLGVLRGWPDVHAGSPILGLPTISPDDTSALDEQGAQVRDSGWSALTGG